MKKIINSPKIILPLIFVIAIFVGIYLYPKIGVSPTPSENLLSKDAKIVSSESNTTLAFPKGGRVESVFVKQGDTVRRGEILAKLSAPDAEGSILQTEAALKLAEAEYSSLNSQYKTTKNQQDLLVSNAYNTLLSSGLEGTPNVQDTNFPIISGTYTCGKEGSYKYKIFTSSDNDSGHSIEFSGLESGTMSLKYDNPAPLGKCGLQLRFNRRINASIDTFTEWAINIPNTKSASYLANKNAYELALATREKVLSDLETTIGQNETSSVSKAKIEAAKGAFEAARGVYQTNLIIAPFDGVIDFVDKDLKNGQSVFANKTVISITAK